MWCAEYSNGHDSCMRYRLRYYDDAPFPCVYRRRRRIPEAVGLHKTMLSGTGAVTKHAKMKRFLFLVLNDL